MSICSTAANSWRKAWVSKGLSLLWGWTSVAISWHELSIHRVNPRQLFLSVNIIFPLVNLWGRKAHVKKSLWLDLTLLYLWCTTECWSRFWGMKRKYACLQSVEKRNFMVVQFWSCYDRYSAVRTPIVMFFFHTHCRHAYLYLTCHWITPYTTMPATINTVHNPTHLTK